MKKIPRENKEPKTYSLSPQVIGLVAKYAKEEKRTPSQFLELLILERLGDK